MFHRVKPDAASATPEKETQTQSTHSQTIQKVSEAPAVEKPRVNAETKPEVKSEPIAKVQPKTPPQKDIKQMNNTQDKPLNIQASDAPTFQRPTAAAQAGGYASSYAAPSYVTPKAEEAAPDAAPATDRTLTIGRGITMSGEIEACDYLLVEGTVEAALKGASVLDISETGTFYGTVEINEATVAGRFEGDLTVAGRLTVRAGGIVTGSIAYGELEVESGAIIDGRMTPLAAVQAGANKPAAQKPAAKVAAPKETQEAANTDGGLFSSQAAS